MTVLYLINSINGARRIEAQAGDAVVLIADAVALACHQQAESLLQTQAHNLEIFALMDDLALRGISAHCSPKVKKIDYPQLVELTIHHHQIQSC